MTTSSTTVPSPRGPEQDRTATGSAPAATAGGRHRSTPPPAAPRVPLRLRLTPPGHHRREARLDGAWWPQTRDLATEVADLVEHYPVAGGRVARVLFSRPDWDGWGGADGPRGADGRAGRPRRLPVGRGWLKVGSFPHDDTHEVRLTLLGGQDVSLLVVPPGLDTDQAEEAMLAGSTPGNRHTAVEVLRTVSDTAGEESVEQWDDDGGTFWAGAVAPSYRPARTPGTPGTADQPSSTKSATTRPSS